MFGSTVTCASKSKTEVSMLHLNPKVSTNVNQNNMPNEPGEIEDWSERGFIVIKMKYLDSL